MSAERAATASLPPRTGSFQFGAGAIGGTAGLMEGNPQQVLTQLYGIVATLVWSGGITFVLLKLVGMFAPLRVSMQQELEGLDISQHGEALQ